MNTPSDKPDIEVVPPESVAAVVENPQPQAVSGGTITSSKQAMLQRQRELERALARSQQVALRVKRKNMSATENLTEPEEEVWLVTYLDMLTLLLVMMVIMVSSAGHLQKKVTESEVIANSQSGILPLNSGVLPDQPLPQSPSSVADNNDPLSALSVDQLGKDVDVIVNEGSISFRISSEILFSSGQAELSLDGLRVLQKIVSVLSSSQHQISVGGHTDAVPIHSVRFPSNWELSSARAGSVVRYLEANGIASGRLRAVGYADTHPLAENASAEGRATNRRVELVLETPKATK